VKGSKSLIRIQGGSVTSEASFLSKTLKFKFFCSAICFLLHKLAVVLCLVA